MEALQRSRHTIMEMYSPVLGFCGRDTGRGPARRQAAMDVYPVVLSFDAGRRLLHLKYPSVEQ